MRKKVLLLAWAALILSISGKAEADDSFQFAPPPFPILNMRSVDVQTNWGIDYVGMKVGDFKFDALNYSASRAVKKWDRGGFSLGGNAMLILGTGKFSGTDISMFGEGVGIQPNWYFDLKGDEEDDFSLPFYFGPHLSMNIMMGSITGSAGGYSYSTFITVASVMYGWQAGMQAGINLNDSVKFIPYLDFSQEVGGSVGTSYSSSYDSRSDSVSIKSMPVAMQPGFDFRLRKINLSLGGALKNSKSAPDATGKQNKTKTTVFNVRFQHKFRSICGI